MAEKKSITQRLVANRLWIQTSFLLVWLDPLAIRLHNVCGGVFHCYACPLATFACPVGVLVNFSALHVLPLMAIGTLVLLGAIFGGFVCGYACPFGLLQDLAAKLPTPKLKLPYWFSYSRYGVLAVCVLAIPYFYGEHWAAFCRICPAGALEASVPNMISQAFAGKPILWPNTIKIIVTLVTLSGMLFVFRFWCRLCPLGAIFGIFNKVSLLFLKVTPSACTSCQACTKDCGYGAQPHKNPNRDICIRCMECTSCKENAISLSITPNKHPTDTN